MKRKLLLCGAVAFAALAVFSGVMLGRQLADREQSAEAFENITAMVGEAVPPVEVIATPVADATVPAESAPDAVLPRGTQAVTAPPIQTAREKYAAVYEQNPDFVGWISVDGTQINYPVMQTPDNPDYYLKRGFDKSYSDYGVPYMQENCDPEQSDNRIIYGHHMKNGSMFSGLCRYESEDFYRAHRIIRFDTLAGFGEYEVLAAFCTVADAQQGFAYHRFIDAEDEAAFDGFIATCKSLALYDTGVTATYGDKLITLSTCEYSRADGRMVVVARRITPSAESADGDAGHE